MCAVSTQSSFGADLNDDVHAALLDRTFCIGRIPKRQPNEQPQSLHKCTCLISFSVSITKRQSSAVMRKQSGSSQCAPWVVDPGQDSLSWDKGRAP